MEQVFTANNLWMMIATVLVFIMHLGFATLETGLTQSKNTVNILFKNATILTHRAIDLLSVGVQPNVPGRRLRREDSLASRVSACQYPKAPPAWLITPEEATRTGLTLSSRECLRPPRRPLFPEP